MSSLQPSRGESEMSNLVEHIEAICGSITKGWDSDPDGNAVPFQVVLLERGPIPGTQTVSTLGLSDIELISPVSGKTIRQELVMLFRSDFGVHNLPALVQQVALERIEQHRALLRGDVIGPRDKLVCGSSMTALYVAIPAYFPDSFHSCKREDGEDVVFAWLVPITTEEAHFVHKRGWQALETNLEERDPDLLDFKRPSMMT